MRILVTGGAGFLGSHLCDRLLGTGHEVVVLDNLTTGSRKNVAHLSAQRRFSLVEQSVTDKFEGSFEQIYNLACPASPDHYQRDPIGTLRTSILGADNLLELASRTGARYFQASTSEVYGDPLVHPQANPIAAMSIRSGRGPATTRANAPPKPFASITAAHMAPTSRWSASSIPTARA